MMKMNLGAIHIDRPMILAPMEDVTDLPFRVLCKRMGADIVVTEFGIAELRGRPGASVSIPLDRIRGLEVWRVEPLRAVTAVLVVALVVVGFSLLKFAPSAGAPL